MLLQIILTVTAITIFLIISFLWGLTYLLPRNDPQNAEFHHGLDTDYKDLKGNSLAKAKVKDRAVVSFFLNSMVILGCYIYTLYFIEQTGQCNHKRIAKHSRILLFHHRISQKVNNLVSFHSNHFSEIFLL